MGKFSMRDDIELKETSLGGGSFLWDTDVYTCIIDMAYFDRSVGGAHSLNLTLMMMQTVNNLSRLYGLPTERKKFTMSIKRMKKIIYLVTH